MRHIVELHGGTVYAESAGMGRGATFTISFPFAAHPTMSAPSRSAIRRTQALDRSGKTKDYDGLADLRVLFIDDDQRTREAVLEVLELPEPASSWRHRPPKAWPAVDTFKPQVILCDIAMPGEDGYAFVRKLRARDRTDRGPRRRRAGPGDPAGHGRLRPAAVAGRCADAEGRHAGGGRPAGPFETRNPTPCCVAH